MRIAICDSSSLDRQNLFARLEQYSLENRVFYHIDQFKSGEELIHSRRKFDLIFLGVMLSGINGFEVCKRLRDNKITTEVVFITRYKEAIINCFQYRPFDFIYKPNLEKSLPKTLNNFLKYFKSGCYIRVKDTELNMNVSIRESEIIFVCADNMYCNIVTEETSYKYLDTMTCIEQILSDAYFVRVHRSYIVNLNHVEAWNNKRVKMKNNYVIPLSRARKEVFIGSYEKMLYS